MTFLRTRWFWLATGLVTAVLASAVTWWLARPDPGDARLNAFVHGRPPFPVVFTSRSEPASLAWAAPEGMKLRLDMSSQIASRIGNNIDPRDLLELAVADASSAETRRTIEHAESRQQALALLLMSPEFQRR